MKFSAIIVHAIFAGVGATSARTGGLGKRRNLADKAGKQGKAEPEGGFNTSVGFLCVYLVFVTCVISDIFLPSLLCIINAACADCRRRQLCPPTEARGHY